MIELRCRFKKAAEIDPETLRLAVKCRSCSARRKAPVYHEWYLTEILERIAHGDTKGVFQPHAQEWVHWIVK